jgi:hypothetical protein
LACWIHPKGRNRSEHVAAQRAAVQAPLLGAAAVSGAGVKNSAALSANTGSYPVLLTVREPTLKLGK